MPHRKVLRSWMTPFSQRRTSRAVLLLMVDYLLLTAALIGTVRFAGIPGKVLCGLAAGFVIGRLFIIGHDAAHQSLTPDSRLNRILGRLAFLPALTPYSLWEIGHNVVHHGYTNLKGFDFVWAPLTRDEYAALPPVRRLLERIYRSGWAPGLYYLTEIWWSRLFFPNRRHMPTRRAVFVWDSIATLAFGTAWIAIIGAAAWQSGQSVALGLATGFAIPFFAWCTMIGFVVYVHHTHEQVRWYDNRSEWAAAVPFISTTVHLSFPLKIGAMMHNIMEHTAHHLDMSIPLYRLSQAQAFLESRLPGRIVIQQFSLRWYFRTARHCKLYDFQRQCWTGYDGQAHEAADAMSVA